MNDNPRSAETPPTHNLICPNPPYSQLLYIYGNSCSVVQTTAHDTTRSIAVYLCIAHKISTTQDFQFPHNQFLTVSHDFLCSSYFHQHAKVTISASGEVSASAINGHLLRLLVRLLGRLVAGALRQTQSLKGKLQTPSILRQFEQFEQREIFGEKRVVGPQC